MGHPSLPSVSINVAITADGKLAPDTRRFTPFSSKHDQQLMMIRRSRVDAVLSGARTVEDGKVHLGPGGKQYQKQRLANGLAEFNLRIIASGSASVDPQAHIFKTRFSPIILLTSEAAKPRQLKRLRPLVDDIFVSPGPTLDFRAVLSWLRKTWNVKTLLCEGGGELNAALLRENLVHQIYVTICPVIFGGRSAPTMADGPGLKDLREARPLKLIKRELIHDELYCLYRVVR